MSRHYLSLPVLLLLAVAVGCEAPPTALDPGSPGFSMHGTSSSEVLTFAALEPVGTSHIVRRSSGLTLRVHTSGLMPGNAYTVWAVVFNAPDECVEECGEDDLFNPGAMADVMYLAGNVVGGTGSSTFAGHRRVGDASGSLFALLGAPSPGLMDAMAAEVHIVVRDHGPAMGGAIPSQIHTFYGACTPESSFDLGDGPNECSDVQFAVHLP